MATVEFLQKRLEGAKVNLEKLQKKLDRIKKAEATNWEVNPYYYSNDDLRHTIRDIDVAQKAIERYENELTTTIEKDNSRDIKIIIDFLNNWKKKAYDFYEKAIKDYFDELDKLKELYSKIKYIYDTNTDAHKTCEIARLALWNKTNGYFEKQSFINRWGKPDTQEFKVEEGEYEYAKDYITQSSYNEAITRLNKDLDEEARRKYDYIIERTNVIVGQITDASNLSVGMNGELNGYIIGTKGKAKITTIGAGGHNTHEIVNVKHGQCFHFRVLIKAMK